MALFSPRSPAYNSIIIYIIIILVVVLTKPDFLYDHEEQKYKEFGIGDNKTLLSFTTFGILSAVILYNLFAYIESFCKYKRK